MELRNDPCRLLYEDDENQCLYNAVFHGFVQKLEELLKNPKYLSAINNQSPPFRVTPLKCAAKAGNVECVKMLLAHGAQVNLVDALQQTALNDAVKAHDARICLVLLRAGANPDGAHTCLSDIISTACVSGFTLGVKLLLDYGCSMTRTGLSHPLKIATVYKNLDCFVLMLLHGIDPNVVEPSLLLTMFKHECSVEFFLLWLQFGGHVDLGKKLVQHTILTPHDATLSDVLSSPEKDESGKNIEDDFSNLPIIVQHWKRMLREMGYYTKIIKAPLQRKLLPEPLKYPYVQPEYTLVLELVGVLVHPDWMYRTGRRFKKRPGVQRFLEELAPPKFEIVIFTRERGSIAFPIIDVLDKEGYISYRLVKDSMDFVDGSYVKNIANLNRDLKKVIVIECNGDSGMLHPRNTLILPRWDGNEDDETLNHLADFLKTIIEHKDEDVRDILEYYSKFERPLEAFEDLQRKQMSESAVLEENYKKTKVTATSHQYYQWIPNFLMKKVT